MPPAQSHSLLECLSAILVAYLHIRITGMSDASQYGIFTNRHVAQLSRYGLYSLLACQRV